MKLTREEFIKKSRLIHGDKYNYSLVNYTNNRTKVSIICPEHGEFEQRPDSHMRLSGCKICSDNKKKQDIREIIIRFKLTHGNRYDYSKSNYISYNLPIIIICELHGEFKQTPHNHIKGTGCSICNGGVSYSTKDFIKKSNKIHNNKYLYNKCNYIKANKKVIITCPEHGDFKQLPYNHIVGKGCRKCGLKYGKLESNWLDNIGISEKNRQYRIKNYLVDGFDPRTNTIYEFYGDFFHGNPNVYNPFDVNPINKLTYGELYTKTINRERYIKSLGYNVISIWEFDYKKYIEL